MTSKTVSRLLLGAVIVMMSGCTAVQPVPEDNYYRITIAVPASDSQAPILHGGLLVDRLQTDALRNGRAIVYRDDDRPLQLQRHHYHFWSESPAKMIQHQLAVYLDQVRTADYVFNTDHALPHRYRLTGRVVEFDRVAGKEQIRSVIKLQFVLTRRGVAGPLLSETYQSEITAAGKDMHAYAKATQQALGQVLDALNHDIQELVNKSHASTL